MASYSFSKSNVKMNKYIKSLCTPAYIYFILAVISTVLYIYTMLRSSGGESDVIRHHYTFIGVVCKIAWHVLFLLFLDYLCRKGYKTISWVILFLPFIMMMMIMVLLMYVFSFISTNDESLKLINQKMTDKKNGDLADSHESEFVNDGRPTITPDGMLIEGILAGDKIIQQKVDAGNLQAAMARMAGSS